MRYIKERKPENEPEDFRKHRESSPEADYNNGRFSKSNLRNIMLEEQGYICAYCMGKLLEPNDAHVEHILPQGLYKDDTLNYMNLVAVCGGRSESYPENKEYHHCDKTKPPKGKECGSVKLNQLNPHGNCESLLTYNLDGKIEAADKNSDDVKEDLDVILNLNNKALIQRRKYVFDRVKEKLTEAEPSKKWTPKIFQKQIEDWEARHVRRGKNAYRPHFKAAVWFLKDLMSQPKYQQK